MSNYQRQREQLRQEIENRRNPSTVSRQRAELNSYIQEQRKKQQQEELALAADAANNRMANAGSAIDFINRYSKDLSAARPGTSSNDVLSQPGYRRAITNTRKAAEEAKAKTDAYYNSASGSEAQAAKKRADESYDNYIKNLRDAETRLRPRSSFDVDYLGALDAAVADAKKKAEERKNEEKPKISTRDINAYTPDSGLYLTKKGREIAQEMQEKADDAYTDYASAKREYDATHPYNDRMITAMQPTSDMYLNRRTAEAADQMQRISDAAAREKQQKDAQYGRLNEQRKITNRAYRLANAALPTEGATQADWDTYNKLYDAAIKEDEKLRALGGAADRTILPAAIDQMKSGYLNAVGTLAELAQRYNIGAQYNSTEEWMNAVKRAHEEPKWGIVDTTQAKADALNERSAQDIAGAKLGRGKLGQTLIDAAVSGTQMLGDAAINAVVPGGGLTAMTVRAFGNAAQEARQRGADVAKQAGYGAAVAGVELFTEKMFDGLAGIYGKGAADDLVEKAIGDMTQSESGKKILKWMSSAGEEGFEELVSGVIDPALESIIDGQSVLSHYNKDTVADIVQSVLVGALLGGLGGTVELATDKDSEAAKVIAEEQKRAETYQSLLKQARVAQDLMYKAQQQYGMNSAEAREIQEKIVKPLQERFDEVKKQSPEAKAKATQESAKQVEQLNARVKDAAERLGVKTDGKSAPEIREDVQDRIEEVRNAKQEDLIQAKADADSMVQLAAMTMGENGVRLAQQFDAVRAFSTSYEAYYNEARDAYDMGRNGEKNTFKGDILTENEAERWYQAGAADARTEESNGGYQQGQSNDAVQERANGMDSAGQSAAVDAGTERAVQPTEGQRDAGTRAAAVQAAANADQVSNRATAVKKATAGVKRVSPSEAGLSNGTSARTMWVLDDNEQIKALPEVQEVYRKAEKENVKVHLYAGRMFLDDGFGPFAARGLNVGDGSEIWLRVDSSEDIGKIEDHELFHTEEKRDAGLDERIRQQITTENQAGQLAKLVQMYAEEYRGSGMTDDEIMREIFADAYAGIDVFDRHTRPEGGVRATDFSNVVRQNVKGSPEKPTGPPAVNSMPITNSQNMASQEAAESIREDLRRLGAEVRYDAVVPVNIGRIMDSPQYYPPVSISDLADLASHDTMPEWAEKYRNGVNTPNAAEWVRNIYNGNMDKSALKAIQRFDDLIWKKKGAQYTDVQKLMQELVPHGHIDTDKFGPLRDNQEYVFTFDMDTSCPRTFQFVSYRNEIQRRLHRTLTVEESINLINLMATYQQMLPCTYCYVETKRILKAGYYNSFYSYHKDVMDGIASGLSVEDLRPKMYGWDTKKHKLTQAAEETLTEVWMKDKSGYNPTIEENYRLVNLIRNDAMHFLDSMQEEGKITASTTVESLKNILAKEYNLKSDGAVAEAEKIAEDWRYDAGQEAEHIYLVDDTGEEFDRKLCDRALDLDHEATNYANSASSAKSVLSYMPYNGNLLNVSDKDRDYVMGMGGIRKHSSNDFRIDYVLDYFQFYADLARGKWTGHTYTKNEDYVRIFGLTGDMINMSIAFDDTADSVVENSNEGMEHAVAKELRKAYPNAGIMAMVTSDKQLSYALNTDWVDMIIPFHHSGLPKSIWYNMKAWNDYTPVQSEAFYDKKEKVAALKAQGINTKGMGAQEISELFDKTFGIKSVYKVEAKKKSDIGKRFKPHFYPNETVQNGVKIPGHNNSKARYLELCKEYGVHPRFDGVTVQDADGNTINVVDHPNYMKLIKETSRATENFVQPTIEFTMNKPDPYLTEKYGKAIGKSKVTPMDYAMHRLAGDAEHVGRPEVAAARDDAGIVNKFLQEYAGKGRPLGWLNDDALNYKEAYQSAQSKLVEAQRDAFRKEIAKTEGKKKKPKVRSNFYTTMASRELVYGKDDLSDKGLIRNYEHRDVVVEAVEKHLEDNGIYANVEESRGMGSYETFYVTADLEHGDGDSITIRFSSHKGYDGSADVYLWNNNYSSVQQLLDDIDKAIQDADDDAQNRASREVTNEEPDTHYNIPEGYGVFIRNTAAKYVDKIFSGEKTVETRPSRTLDSYLHKWAPIIDTAKHQVIGEAFIDSVIEYDDVEDFRADADRHLVPDGSKYDWDGKGKRYGYVITETRKYDTPRPIPEGAKKFGRIAQSMYSLEPVAAVKSTGGWERGATFDEVKATHPTLFELAADEAEVRNPTQITGTVKTYRKIYDILKAEGFKGKILDASSGLGVGTEAGRSEYGFDVDDIEPFPDAKYKPKYTDYSKLNKKYDAIISNAVLNVIPQDLRDAMVVKIGQLLAPGGKAFINVRGTDVKNASSKVAINEDGMEYFISDSGSYQKGFRKAELVSYLKDALGDQFTVEPTTQFGGVAAIITKNDGQNMASRETDEQSVRSLRNDIQNLEEQIELADVNELSAAERRALETRLVKANADLDKLTAKERSLAKRTSINDLIANLDSYRRSDLESLAEQVSDGAWDDYEDLSDNDLRDALRETLNERAQDLTVLERQVPKYGYYVRPAETMASRETDTRLREKNIELQQRLDAALADTKQSNGWRAAQKDVDRVAADIVAATSSKESKAIVGQKIRSLVEAASNGKIDSAEMKDLALDIARNLVKRSSILVSPDSTSYDTIRDTLKKLYIKVPAEIRQEMRDWKAFAAAHKAMQMKTDGVPISEVYARLRNQVGEEYFPDLGSDIDRLQQIATILDNLTPIYDNPYSVRMADTTEEVANSILESILDIGQAEPTYADRAKAREGEVRELYQQKLAEQKEYLQGRIQEEADKRKEQIESLKQHYAEVKEMQRTRKQESADRQKLLRVAKRLQNRKLTAVNRAIIDQLVGDLDTVSVNLTNKSLTNLRELADWYDSFKDDPNFISVPQVEEKLKRLEKRHIGDMTIDEVRELTDVLRSIENALANYGKMIRTEDRRLVSEMSVLSQENIRNTKGVSKKNIGDWLVTNTLAPERLIRRLTGYNDTDPLYMRTKELSEGQRKMFDYQMRAEKMFSKWTNDRKLMDNLRNKETVTVRAFVDGKETTVEITPDMRMALYLHSLNDQNLKHIMNGGVRIPDIKLYRKGDTKEAYSRGVTAKMSPDMVRGIANGMSAEERAFANAAHKYFNGMSRDEINAVSEALLGYSLAGVEDYFPIQTDDAFTQKEIDAIQNDGSIQGMGFTKERQNASNAIYLVPMTDVLKRSIQNHAKYVGMAIPVANMNKLWMANTKDGETDTTSGLKDAMRSKWGDRANEAVEKILTDVQNPMSKTDDASKLLAKIRSNYAGAVLTLNASVALKQAASYPTAAAVLGWAPLIKAMGNVGKVDLDIINKYTPLQWYRSKGYSTQEIGDIKSRGGIMDKVMSAHITTKDGREIPLLNWIQGIDLATTRKLWKASEYYVQQNQKNLNVGSDEYNKAVADIYNRVIEETQPNYTTLQRPQLLRSDNQLLQSFVMFKTQPFQNFNILYDAIGELRTAERLAKNGDNSKLVQAKKNAVNAVTSNLVSAAVFAAMTMAWALARKKKDKYEDEGGNFSPWKQLGKDFLSSEFGMLPFGTDVYNILSAWAFGEKYYGMSNITADSISGALDSTKTACDEIKGVLTAVLDGNDETKADPEKMARKLFAAAQDASKLFGIPLDNVINLVTAVYSNVASEINGEYVTAFKLLALTKGFSSTANKGKAYDMLYKAYVNGDETYDQLVQAMLATGEFSEKQIRDNIGKRIKDSTKGSNDMLITTPDDVYLLPNERDEYDALLDAISGSSAWAKATEVQQGRLKNNIYQIAIGSNSGQKILDKVTAGADVGVTTEDYLEYQLALTVADATNPDEKKRNSSYDQDEAAAAIDMLEGLNEAQKRYLWSSTNSGWKEDNNPYGTETTTEAKAKTETKTKAKEETKAEDKVDVANVGGSSAISAASYDPKTKTVSITYKSNGKTYTYDNVTQDEWDAFKAAESKGSYVSKHWK